MANLYLDVRFDPHDYVRQGISLYELLVSGLECRIDGITFLHKGTQEWKDYAAEFEKALGKMPQNRREEVISRRFKPDIISKSTDFCAMNRMSKVLAYDKQRDMICDILIPQKEIHVFKLFSEGCEILPDFIIGGSKKAGSRKLYHYDGSLRDALEEFPQEFTFNLWNTEWMHQYLRDEESASKYKIHYKPVECVGIDHIFLEQKTQ